MKKHFKLVSKKIMILTLVASLVFTSVFSSRKMEARAASVTVALGAYSLYEICLYIGGLAVSALGVGYVYDNRDEIAQFGKSVIDSMDSIPTDSWLFGSRTAEGSIVYGSEALEEVQQADWSFIQGGGQSPKNDNDGDGDKDSDDTTEELSKTSFFTLSAGVILLNNAVHSVYEKWANKEENNIMSSQYGEYGSIGFSGFKQNSEGKYVFTISGVDRKGYHEMVLTCDAPIYAKDNSGPANSRQLMIRAYGSAPIQVYDNGALLYASQVQFDALSSNSGDSFSFVTDMPVFLDYNDWTNAYTKGTLNGISNEQKFHAIDDWMQESSEDEDDLWELRLAELALAVRALTDIVGLSTDLTDSAFNNQPTAEEYSDMMVEIGNEYPSLPDTIDNPVYYPNDGSRSPVPPEEFPNYSPDSGGGSGGDIDNPDNPDGSGEDETIDLDGLLSIFNILFYLIMIIIMLIFLFLECLAFIVMIFRVPASSAMLPEEMILGLEHLKSIMIPGMNISIYGFAMALIYLFIVFAVIRLLRQEINHFKIPRWFGK